MLIVSAFRLVLRLIGVALVAFIPPALLAQSSSPAIDGFDPNVNGNVYAALVQPDGKILVAGSFTTVQPNGATAPTARNNIARLLPDGQIDATFTADVGGQINSMALQADGRIVIGGRFTTVGADTRNRVARLESTGVLDRTFDPNVGGSLTPEVNVVLVQTDGRVLVGGGFTTAQPNGAAEPTTRNRIARFNTDGSLDPTFNPSANSFVLSMAQQPDGKILIGGGFTAFQPNGAAAPTERHRIARLNPDGTLDAFNPKANNAVTAIEVRPNGQILIGGSFTSLQPNGAADATTTNVTRLARLNPDGAIDTSFIGYADAQVYSIKAQANGRILIGGAFGSLGDGNRAYFGRILPSGRLDFSFAPGPNYIVYAIATQPDGAAVIAGGFISLAGRGASGIVRNHVARVLESGMVDANFHPDVNGRLNAVLVQADGRMLVSGTFTSLGGETHFGIARLEATGAVDSSFTADVAGGTVLAMAQQADGKILIGGNFIRINGAGRINFARLNPDGTLDTSFDFAVDNSITSIAVRPDGKILIGGGFTNLRAHGASETKSRPYLALVNADGSLDEGFNPFPNEAVTAITLQPDGKILLGGEFTAVAGHGAQFSLNRLAVARLNADGTMDEGFNPSIDGSISSIAVQADGKILIGGDFFQLRPGNAPVISIRSNLVRFNADGTLDEDFDPNPNRAGPVYSISVQADGKILIGGRFTSLQPKKTGDVSQRTFLARLNSDGTVDPGFDAGLDALPGNQVIAAIPFANGKTLVAGAFTTLQSSSASPVRRNRLALVNADGTADPAFDAGLATSVGAAIESLTVQTNGRVFVAGNFAGLGGTESANLARFHLDSSPDTTFTPNLNGPVYAVAQQLTKGEAVPTPRVGFAVLENNGQQRPSFTVPANVTMPTIHTIVVQSDGKMLIGGTSFTTPSGSTSLVRLHADGTLDETFQPKTVGEIFAIAIDANGKILVGGAFAKVGDVDRFNIARLNADGSLDTAFTLVTNSAGTVFTIAIQGDGRIVLGGSFTSVIASSTSGTTVRAFLARVGADGAVDASFDPNFNSSVGKVLIRPDGKILAVGSFTALRPNGATTTTTRAFAAQFNPDGGFDSSFDLKLNGAANELALQADGKIVIGGNFTRVLDQTRNNLARINSDNTLDAFNPNPNGPITSVAVQSDGRILVSGGFSALQPNTDIYNPALAVPRSRAARLEIDGTVDPTFNPNFNNTVSDLVPGPNNAIIAVGAFNATQPTGGLIVGGAFSSVNGIPVQNLALFGHDGSVSAGFLPNPNGAVYAILPLTNGNTVVGGAFTSLAGVERNRLARFTAIDELDPGFNPNFNGEVRTIAAQADGRLIVGGDFTTVAGAARSYLVRLNNDGSVDSTFTPAVAGAVHNLVIQSDGRVLITQAIDADTNSLVRLNADGTSDGTFSAANNGAVRAIALQTNGQIVVGGSFTQIGGAARSHLARLETTGAIDATLTSAPNGPVTALTVQSDGKILLGGMFNQVDGIDRFGIARIGASGPAIETLSVDANRTTVTWFRSGTAPEIADAVFDTSPDDILWTTIGRGARIAGTSNWQISGATLPTDATYFVRARGVVPASPRSSSGATGTQRQFFANVATTVPAPTITSATVVDGLESAVFYYSIAGTNQPTQYSASGLPEGLTIDPHTGLISGTPTTPGTYPVVLSAGNAGGTTTTQLTLIVRAAAGNPVGDGKLVNVSINAQVTSTDPIIAGFVIKGVFPQTVLVRGLGPSLENSGVADFLAQPHLRIFNSTGAVIAENAGWNDDPVLLTTFARLGAGPLPAGSKDAAMLLTLKPGVYTMHVSSANAGSGYAMAEVYDASTTFEQTWPRLVNLSGRSIIDDSRTIVTGGFVIEGPAARRVLIRGVGPAMSGVPNVLSDPTLALYSSVGPAGTVIATNDNWGTPVAHDATYPPASAAELSAAFAAAGAGAFTAGSADAAIIVTLAPGVYTAQVGRNGTATGSAMVEIYELDVP